MNLNADEVSEGMGKFRWARRLCFCFIAQGKISIVVIIYR